MTNITADVKLEGATPGGPTEYYGKLVVSNIKYENGDSVKTNCKKFLVVVFRSPVSKAPVFWYQTTPNVDITEYIHLKPDGINEYTVTAYLFVKEEWTIDSSTHLSFGIDGNLKSYPEHWITSLHLAVGHEPTA